MKQLLTAHKLRRVAFSCKHAEQICAFGFVPAFYNKMTMTGNISRFTSGAPAPIHLLDSVPADWVARRSANGKIVALKETVIAGYMCNGFFYTPEEVAVAIGL